MATTTGDSDGTGEERRIVGDSDQPEAYIPLRAGELRNRRLLAELAQRTALEIYERADERWAWRLVAGNGQVIATDGSQGYENRSDCERIGKAVVVGLYAPRDLA